MRTLDEVLLKHPLPLKNPDGSPAQLKPLQVEDINKMAALGRVLGDLPVGYGKTAIATSVSLMLEPPSTLVLVPPILVEQWVQWLRAIPGAGRVVAYDGAPRERRALPVRGARWVVSSYGMFKNDLARLLGDMPEAMTIMDECFPAGTLVQTPDGARHIEALKAGELVFTSAGPKRIVETFENLASQLSFLELSNGSIITCTSDHPIFTDLGWVCAQSAQGRFVLHDTAVSDLQQGVQPEDLQSLVGADASVEHRNYLFKNLHDGEAEAGGPGGVQTGWAENEGPTETRTSRGWNASRASERAAQEGRVGHVEGDEVEANHPQGQRDWYDTCRSIAVACLEELRVRLELCGRSGLTPARVSDQLQAGFRPQRLESGAGAGREQPLCGHQKSSGQKEGSEAGRVWVVRVSTAQQGARTPVYNLHVAGRHDYFAGGILVHNCQNAKSYKSQMFKSLKDFSDGRPLLLMSGTIMSGPADGYAYVKLNNPLVYPRFVNFTNLHVAEWDFFNNPKKWANLDMLQANLDLSRVKRTKEEVHAHLPKANFIPLEYSLPPEHMALYRQLMDEQLLEIGDGKIDATTAGKLHAASQQIIANWGYFADDETVRPKLFDLIDMTLDEIGIGQPLYPGERRSKLIIWTIFRQTSRRVLAYINAKGVVKGKQAWYAAGAYGEVDSKAGIKAFMEDPKCLVLIAQPKSAGAGLNPQYVCNETLFAETPTTTIPFTQCYGRIDREGQVFNPNIRLAVAKGTIQQSLLKNLFTNDGLVQQASGDKQSIKDLIYPK